MRKTSAAGGAFRFAKALKNAFYANARRGYLIYINGLAIFLPLHGCKGSGIRITPSRPFFMHEGR
jgi:hypothetical protein